MCDGCGKPRIPQGLGSALKPAWEPIVLARKPLISTLAANVERYGTGALNIDGCRIVASDHQYAANCSGDRGHTDNRTRAMDFGLTAGHASPGGRWPANVVLDEDAAALLDEQTGHLLSHEGSDSRALFRTPMPDQTGVYGQGKGLWHEEGPSGMAYGDQGGASRFFYCAKASPSERNRGLDDLKASHPTVKPIALMRWLCRLVTPPDGLILDPFLGSGSTGVAAIFEGFDFLGFEREHQYVEIARRRLIHATTIASPIF